MDEVAPRRSAGGWIGGVMTHHPKGAIALVLVLVLQGLGAWWALQLSGLPDIGEPFDVESVRSIRVSDDRNAFLEYSVAASLIRAVNRRVGKPGDRRELSEDWATANPSWRELVTEGREALDVWKRGTEKPDAFYDHPGPVSIRTLLPVTQELRNLAQLAVLEGARLEAEENFAGAWAWYRATLRSSRHCGRHGFQVERLVGSAIHKVAAKSLSRWATQPKVDATLLRGALDEVIAIDALTIPRSETIKLEYLVFVNELDDPNLIEDVLVSKNMYNDDHSDWCRDLPISDARKQPIQATRVILNKDRERSLRLARLLTANWLAEDDKPASRRAKVFRNEPRIYEVGPDAPPASRVLTASELSRWVDTSLIAVRFFREFHQYEFSLDRERTRQARLVVHLASELYRREHGTLPDSPEKLVGLYLKTLPEGYDTPEEPAPK